MGDIRLDAADAPHRFGRSQQSIFRTARLSHTFLSALYSRAFDAYGPGLCSAVAKQESDAVLPGTTTDRLREVTSLELEGVATKLGIEAFRRTSALVVRHVTIF